MKTKIKIYKPKIITRKYISKKTGKEVTKIYQYKSNKKYSNIVLKYQDENGKTKRITERTILKTKKGYKSEVIEKIANKYNLNVNEIQNKLDVLELSNKKTNIKTLLSALETDSVKRFLKNMDIDYDELIEDIQMTDPLTDEAWILNRNHWIGTITTQDGNVRQTNQSTYQVNGPLELHNGTRVYFNWNYEQGSTWEIY